MNLRNQFYLRVVAMTVALLAGITLGSLLGWKMGVRNTVKNAVYSVIGESVGEYHALAAGETNRARTICSQRIWTYLDLYEREFRGNKEPLWFTRKLPEAQRIVGVISNEDRHNMVVTDQRQLDLLRRIWELTCPTFTTQRTKRERVIELLRQNVNGVNFIHSTIELTSEGSTHCFTLLRCAGADEDADDLDQFPGEQREGGRGDDVELRPASRLADFQTG